MFKKNQHITNTPKKFIKDKIGLDVYDDPKIELDKHSIINCALKYNIDKNETNILLGVGGSANQKNPCRNIFTIDGKNIKN